MGRTESSPRAIFVALAVTLAGAVLLTVPRTARIVSAFSSPPAAFTRVPAGRSGNADSGVNHPSQSEIHGEVLCRASFFRVRTLALSEDSFWSEDKLSADSPIAFRRLNYLI